MPISLTHLAAAVIFLACAAAHGGTQETLSAFQGTQNEALGWAIEALGDLDGDGVSEIAVSAPRYRPAAPFGIDIGRVQILSGASLVSGAPAILSEIVGPLNIIGCAGAASSNFGNSIAGGRDINGDGTPDFVISASLPGIVIAYDGATGAPMLPLGSSLDGPCPRRHGAQVRLLDADGDAYADLLVTQAAESTVFRSRYIVYRGEWIQNPSGGSTKELYSVPSSGLRDLLGSQAVVLGDIDGDQRDDFALSAPTGGTTSFQEGSVAVISGADGTVLHRFGPPGGGENYAYRLAALPDRDGDGLAELAVSQLSWPTFSASRGRIEVVSGAWMASGGGAGTRTLEFLTIPAQAHVTALGGGLAAADINGDGFADVLASSRGVTAMEWTAFSGRTGNAMWTKTTSQPPTAYYPTTAEIIHLGETQVSLLGMPETSVGGFAIGGELVVARAHDGAGRLQTTGVGCPCGLDDPDAGCPNSTGSGATLAVESGSLRLGAQSLNLTTSGLAPFSFGLLFGGMPSAPSTVSNGFIGVGQPIRWGVRQSNGAGVASVSGDLLGDFTAGSTMTPGSEAPMVGVPFAVQLWYRDFGCSGTTNFSNTYVVIPRL